MLHANEESATCGFDQQSYEILQSYSLEILFCRFLEINISIVKYSVNCGRKNKTLYQNFLFQTADSE